jgi:hypothetical protein
VITAGFGYGLDHEEWSMEITSGTAEHTKAE